MDSYKIAIFSECSRSVVPILTMIIASTGDDSHQYTYSPMPIQASPCVNIVIVVDYYHLLSITQLMTEDGNPKDNAQAERINNTLKNELLKGKSFCDIKEVREAVEKAVLFYNTERPHMSINMMTPQEAATHTGEIKKGWTSYRDIAIKNLQTENIITNKCLSLGA